MGMKPSSYWYNRKRQQEFISIRGKNFAAIQQSDLINQVRTQTIALTTTLEQSVTSSADLSNYPFAMVDVQLGNTDVDNQVRWTLMKNGIQIVSYGITCENGSGTVNVVLGEGNPSYAIPGNGTVASAGSSLFASGAASFSSALAPTYGQSPTTAIWPAGSNLTVRCTPFANANPNAFPAVTKLQVVLGVIIF